MKQTTFFKNNKLATLYILLFFSHFSSIGQINYTQDFNGCNAANCSGWTIASGYQPSITSTTGSGYSPCANSSAKSDIYGTSTTTTLTSNGSLGTSNGTLTTFSFNYKCIDYNTGSATAANSCTYTVAWSPDGTTWTTISTFQNTSSATCIASPNFTFTPPNGSQVRIRITAVRTAGDFWAVFDDLSLVQLASPTLLNYSANPTLSTSFAHRRGASINPKFTIQAPSTFNAVQIEMNHASDFSGTALVSTITTGGPYNANTPYDFWTTQNLAGDRTYFVRVRVSNNGGSTYGAWSNQLWPYSYYPATTYPEEGWYYTTQEQFQTGVVQETLYNFLSIQNNSTAYPDDDYMQVNEGNFSINATTNDGVYENSTWYPSVNYMTIGWQNNCNGNAAISNGFPFITNIPQAAVINSANFSVVATDACFCETQNVSMRLIFDAHNVDNGAAFTGANVSSIVTPARTTANQTFLYSTTWSNNTRYTLTSVSNILQEIVNRPGWSAGNRFNLMGRWNSSFTPGANNNRCIRQADFGATDSPRLDVTFTNFKNTVRFPNVNRAIYGPDATAWDELRITDNTVGCGTCYTEYRIHDASTNVVLAGPFIRTAGNSGSQYFDISGVAAQNIYVTASMFRNNSPQIQDIWLTTITPSPLPVEQGAFEGRCNDNNLIELNWNSISENNTNYIAVESSKDAISWETIETQNAQGNSTEITYYNTTVRTQKDYNYYRLKWVDLDGKHTYSQIIYVSCENKGISIFPNPNNGTFVISGANLGDNYQIYNPQGQKVKEGLISSTNTIVEIKNISSGTYIIKLENTDKVLHFKVISN